MSPTEIDITVGDMEVVLSLAKEKGMGVKMCCKGAGGWVWGGGREMGSTGPNQLTCSPQHLALLKQLLKRTVHFLDHITDMWTFPLYLNYTKKHAIVSGRFQRVKSLLSFVTGIVSVNVSFHPQGRSLC